MANIEDLWVRKDRTRRPEYGKGLRWRVVWYEPDGRRLRKSFSTKDAASEHMKQVSAELTTGTYHSRSSGTSTVAEYAEIWLKDQVNQRASSVANIRRRLDNSIIPALGETQLRDLTRAEIQAAVAEWSEVLAASTVKTTYVYLAGMLKAAVTDKHLRDNPCVGVKLPKVEHSAIVPLTVAQVQTLVGTLFTPYKLPVVVAAATGLRPSELFGITWDRVDLDKGLIKVDRQLLSGGWKKHEWGPLKTDSSYRTVKIGPATVEHLRRHEVANSEGLVFQNVGHAISRVMRSKVWTIARETLPHIGPGWHQLRHHHASLLIAAGLSPVAVAHRLGHKDATETLKTYGHLWPDDDVRMAAASDGLLVLQDA